MANVAVFVVLTYALAWAFFFGGVVTGNPHVFLPGVFAPAVIAILLTWWKERAGGVRALLKRVVQWKVRWTFYAFAIFFLAAIKLAAALIHRWTFGAWPTFGTTPLVIVLAATLLSTPVQAGEEIGWRGYMLPRLAERIGFGGASVVVGVVWALWHIPQFYLPAADTFRQSLPLFVLQVTALSVAMAWLYVRTDGSLLLTMLMHAAINNTKDVVPSAGAPPVAWIALVLLWIAAALFLVRMSPVRRSASAPAS